MTRKKRFTLHVLWLAAAVSLGAQAAPLAPTETDPLAIMKAVFDRNTGTNASMKTDLTIYVEGDSARQRKLRRWSKKFQGGTKTFMVFEEPADLRNTSFLSVDYDDGGKSDDQWLYLPALHRPKRITSSGRADSFMGSDFTYADLSRSDPNDYELKLVDPAAKVDGEECWVIEATPKTARVKEETGYLKKQVWVSKAKGMELQVKAWVIQGKKLKYLKMSDVRQVQGVWTAHQLEGRTLAQDKLLSRSVVQSAQVKYDDPAVTDDLFTERRLEQGL
jgi:hypothetical protein